MVKMLIMESRRSRRLGVIVNHASVVLLAVLVCLGEYRGWSGELGGLSATALAIAVFSFASIYGRTGFWKLVRSQTRELDERQLEITHASFRRSYAVVGVVSLVLLVAIVASVRFSIFTLTFRGHYSFGLVALVFLNYLINVLPASFLAWTEKSPAV